MTSHGPPTKHPRKAWLVVLAAFGAALASALLVGGARSATPTQGLIAFTRSDGIYVMRSDGSGVRARRGRVAASAFGLAWSPDGRTLAFASSGDDRGLWVMSADGANLSRLAVRPTPPGTGPSYRPLGGPTWSHDGRSIAFTAYNDDARDRDIWVMDADGSNLRTLVRTPRLFEIGVTWSPAGSRVAFWGDGYFPHVYVMRTDGSDLRRLTPWGIEAAEPSWSPDGRRIAFTRLGASDSFLDDEIFVTDPSGHSRVQLTRNEVQEYQPVWSPDGRRLALVRSRGVAGRCIDCPVAKRASSEIYVMNVDGTGVTMLTNNRLGEGSLAWQPVRLP